MNGNQATAGIINLLSESDSAFVRINFFDISSASASAANEFANISPSAIRQFFPIFEFAFVLRAGSHCTHHSVDGTATKSSYARDTQTSTRDARATQTLPLIQPPLQNCRRVRAGLAVTCRYRKVGSTKEEWSAWDARHRTRRDRGNGAFGQGDIEGKAAMGSGE
jgi:hypothetical protein